MKYIKINAVLNRVPSAIKEESDNSTLLSYALDAYRMLNITQYNMETVAFIDIINNQGKLPSDINEIKGLYYLTTKPTEQNICSLKCETCNACPSEFTQQTNPSCQHSINYQLFLDSDYLNNCYTKMSYKGNKNSLCKQCRDYNNQYEYTINPLTNTILTKLNNCTLCLTYKTELKDLDGDFLITDNIKVINFMRTWIMYRHWENRGYSKEQNAYRISQDLLRQSEILLKSAKGSILQRNIDIDAVNRATGINDMKSIIKIVESYGEHSRY